MNKEATEAGWNHLIESLQKDPGAWDQRFWLSKLGCGTGGCYFGHVALAHGFVPNWSAGEASYGWAPSQDPATDIAIPVRQYAMDRLDLGLADASQISDFMTSRLDLLRDRILEVGRDHDLELDLPLPGSLLDKLVLASSSSSG